MMMIVTYSYSIDDEIDNLNDSYSDDLDVNTNEKPPLSASTKSSNNRNNNNWDVHSLLDKFCF